MFISFSVKINGEKDEIFIDGTFKVAPKNWFQLLNIYRYIKIKNIYIPLTYGLLSSKTKELYTEFITQLLRNIKYYRKIFFFRYKNNIRF